MANAAYQSTHTGAQIDAAVSDVANKLSTSGGTMTGNLIFNNSQSVQGTLTNGNVGDIMYVTSANRLLIGSGFRTNANFADTRIYGYTGVSIIAGNTSILSASSSGVDVNGTITATSLIKSGGTSTQILMADGSTVEAVKVFSGSSAPSSSVGSDGDIYIQT